MENEKKKGNGPLIFIIVMLLIIIIGLTFIILKDKEIIKIGNSTSNSSNTTKETTVVKNEKKDTTTEVVEESKIIYSGEKLIENKDFGKVVFGGKEVNIKFDNGDGAQKKIYVDDKYIEIINGGVNNIAIMGNYLVVGIDQDGYRFELYNFNLEKVDKVGNSIGYVFGTTADTSKWIIDNNDLIYYECKNDATSSSNYRLDTYNLKIDGSKIEKVLLESTKDITCTSQS